MKILITGSRDWTDRAAIENAFDQVQSVHDQYTLISGACPTGADRMGEEIAQEMGWDIERYPADWDKYGKRAGFLRNAEMVALNPDITLAFIKNESKGASMTAGLSEKAGIKTVRIIE